jgi:hypothetical protein
MWPGWVRVPLPSFVPRVKRPTTIWGAFALGAVFFDRRLPGLYAGACHLARRSRRDRVASFWRRAVACFLPGPRIPIALGAWAAGLAGEPQHPEQIQKGFEIAGAVTLIASGLYMLNAYYFWIPSLAI